MINIYSKMYGVFDFHYYRLYNSGSIEMILIFTESKYIE